MTIKEFYQSEMETEIKELKLNNQKYIASRDLMGMSLEWDGYMSYDYKQCRRALEELKIAYKLEEMKASELPLAEKKINNYHGNLTVIYVP